MPRSEATKRTYTSDVVREALRLLVDHEKATAAQRREFRAELDRRTACLDRGKGLDGEEVFAAIRKTSEERRKKSA